jgi:hypothetical protein
MGKLVFQLLDGQRYADAATERTEVAAVARKIDEIVARRTRLATATPDRTRLAELVELTRGLDGAAAWRKLVALGRLPAEGERAFWTERGPEAVPDELEVCIGFACDVPSALRAEEHYRAFCAAAGLPGIVAWDSLVGSFRSIDTIEPVRRMLQTCTQTEHHDRDRIAIASMIYDGQPNPFSSLYELYATCVELEADSEGSIALRLPSRRS